MSARPLAFTSAHAGPEPAGDAPDPRHLYQHLSLHGPGERSLQSARAYLATQLAHVSQLPCDLPDDAAELSHWATAQAARTHLRYADYLRARKSGAPRHFFGNRAHALHFLRGVAPTKLVDGAWLYATARLWRDARCHGLLRTYLEELGDGQESKNHVLLYRRLLAANGAEQWQDLPGAYYTQGAIQLALAYCGEDYLPELIGFNLGYEQLPLHLLITAYELDELGIDPYYFTLHVTVDNLDSGHARRAIDAVHESLPALGAGEDAAQFWERVRRGYQLNELGMGTMAVIRNFDIEREVLDIFVRKSVGGHGAHSDYCKVAGRTVNDWLSAPEQVPYFLDALKRAGWIEHGADVSRCRFWQLLRGERASMFGVFSGYELQMIHDWLRGDASRDGLPYDHATRPAAEGAAPPARQPSFRAMQRLRERGQEATTGRATGQPPAATLDRECAALDEALAALPGRDARVDYLSAAITPRHHWLPVGLHATRLFARDAFA